MFHQIANMARYDRRASIECCCGRTAVGKRGIRNVECRSYRILSIFGTKYLSILEESPALTDWQGTALALSRGY